MGEIHLLRQTVAAFIFICIYQNVASEKSSGDISFPFPLYETFITEGKTLRKNFFAVKAKTTSQAAVKYSMTSLIDSRSQNFFDLNEDTGELSTIAELDREFMNIHYFKVVATLPTEKAGTQTATTTVQITVKDANDNGPIFEHKIYNATVKESLPIGSSIVTVRASDIDYDNNGKVTYTLTSDDSEDENFFRIDPNTGVIALRASLDRELKEKHVLTVVATDNAAPNERRSANATVVMNLIDENDNVPMFTKRIYYIDIPEDKISQSSLENAAPIGKVTAVDADAGENAAIKYSIISGNKAFVFSIDSETGEIYLQQNLDREVQDSYKLIIRAQDLGSPPNSNTTQVIVNVQDINDNSPRFPSANYYQSVAEDVPEGYSILQVTAFDPDQGGNSAIRYTLRDPQQSLPFMIEEATGWIKTKTPLDREVAGSYRFLVEAQDGGEPSLSALATIQITVLDRNDNDPVMAQRIYDVSISESAPLGSEIVKVVANDPDENSELRYEIISGNVGNVFSISMHQGVGLITIAQPLNFNKEQHYKLSVNAVDSGGRFATTTVNINVTDSNNHAPRFENTPYVVDVFEDTPAGSTILMLFATDADHGKNAKINYRMSPASDKFSVERDTGALVVSSALDRESMPTYILTVIAEDGGITPLADQTEVEISVVDVNDNAPRFSSSQYQGSINENSPAGTSILDVTANDDDDKDNGKVYYRFVGKSDDERSFSIDSISGIIRTKRPLDRETREYYDLMVEAYDAGIPEMSSMVHVGITVLDLNDNPPRFANDTIVFKFPENLPSGSKVGIIEVEDPDIGQNAVIKFRLLNNTDEKYFFIDESSSTGTTTLYSKREFDYEVDRREYQLLLRAESEPLRTDVVVLVQLTDVNDNHPTIEDFDIVFNNKINEYFSGSIGFIPAKDADPTSQLHYNFTYGNNANLLHLDPNTGAIKLSPSLKSNVNVEAKVGVSVTDGKNEARANFRLRLNYVTEKMLQNSVTLRLANVTSKTFLTPFYQYLIEGLSVVIPCDKSQIQIFSIRDDDTGSDLKVLNVTFSTTMSGTHDEQYLDQDYIKQRIYLHKEVLQKLMLLEMLPFDDNICVREPCLNFERCSSLLKFGGEDRTLESKTLMFRSVDPVKNYACSCPAGFTGMKTRYTCDTQINLCYSNPCKNNGTCLSHENGYVCQCPENFGGKSCEIDLTSNICSDDLCERPANCVASSVNSVSSGRGVMCRNCSDNPFFDEFCRLRSRSFSRGTYAAFPAIQSRNEFNITLEFTTQSEGLIFYNGRLNNENDFIALEVVGKSVVFKYSTGDRTRSVSVTSSKGFTDGYFHRVEILYKNETSTLTVGADCDKRLALKYGNSLREDLRCSNHTAPDLDVHKCGFYTGNCIRFLDLNGPFVLGGIPEDNKRTDMIASSSSFMGCISNLHIDRQIVNLDLMVYNNGSVSGCPEKRDFCVSSPCKNNGKCTNGWGSFICTCGPQWTGKNCGTAVGRVFGVDKDTEVVFQQELTPIQIPWQMAVSFRTKSTNGTLLSVKMGDDSDVYKIDLIGGTVAFLHRGNLFVTGHATVNDNVWHDVQVKWMEGEVWLNIDYGQFEVTQTSVDSVAGKIATKIYSGRDQNNENFFKGCIQNVRVGSRENSNLEVSSETGVTPCSDDTLECDKSDHLKCKNTILGTCASGDECVCPFEDGKCVGDFCELDLCEKDSVCSARSNGGFICQCNGKGSQGGPYCESEPEEVCPGHWWGSPVCGPCNCDTAHGFNESCDAITGTCRCKENHFIATMAKKNGGQDIRCMPCKCFEFGSTSQQCDIHTGRCSCKTGVSGDKCDACAHDFAELTASGCHVIYGSCPAEFRNDIWWPRTSFGDTQNATCPEKAVGLATRSCLKSGWSKPDLTGCMHEEFLHLSQLIQNKSNIHESWVLTQKSRDLILSAMRKYSMTGISTNPGEMASLYNKDVVAVEKLVHTVLEQEAQASGFQLSHKKDREFLDNFVNIVSWITENENATKIQDVRLVSSLADYGLRLADSMEATFTNPFEIVSNSVVFGLDTIKHLQQSSVLRRKKRATDEVESVKVKIPKYNNYMKKPDNWNTAAAYIDVSSDQSYKLQYGIYKTRRARVERKFLFVPNLLWGTEVHLFSEIFALSVRRAHEGASVYEPDEDKQRILTFHGNVEKPHNQLHCVTWDRDLWNSIDCETEREDGFSFGFYDSDDVKNSQKLPVIVNCTCQSGRIFAVIEETIADGRDYLDTRTESIVFSICSAVSLAVLLMTTLSLTCLNSTQKTSVRIHRNITFCVLNIQVFLLLVVLANTQLTDYLFLCTFISMCLHYFSVALFTWVMIDSVHIYRMLSELRDINHGRMTFYGGFGFGIPALVVGLTVGVSGNNYTAGSFCWLSYYRLSVWGMLGPEIGCAVVHMITMFANLNTVFRVKNAADIEDDFKLLRNVFFVNLGLLPLIGIFHAAAMIMINERNSISVYVFVAVALLLSFYLVVGFVLCDRYVLREISMCTSRNKKKNTSTLRGFTSNPHLSMQAVSRSALTYRQSSTLKKNRPNNLDVAEVSVASTTSQSTYQTSSKLKIMNFDDPDGTRSYNLHSQNSESDSDIDRRSLDLASSHTSDDEYDTNLYEQNDLKALSVNDYPQY